MMCQSSGRGKQRNVKQNYGSDKRNAEMNACAQHCNKRHGCVHARISSVYTFKGGMALFNMDTTSWTNNSASPLPKDRLWLPCSRSNGTT
mmetsp:Transcript_2712/g.4922  ORF Transcript_2712/g.4922 Transcript_2712/m.4922 type:complete len:90 (-) Transcript_2712:952-1221(-)